jgi:hypothetical protein
MSKDFVAADRASFRENPSRAHRLRPLFVGEKYIRTSSFKFDPTTHAIWQIIRQLSPEGWLVGFSVCLNVEDAREAMHSESACAAIFDLLTGTDDAVTIGDVDRLARAYESAAAGRLQ